MLLICPACSTSYRVADMTLGPAGRKVKCHKCQHVWTAKPTISGPPAPPAEIAADAPEPMPAAIAPTEPGPATQATPPPVPTGTADDGDSLAATDGGSEDHETLEDDGDDLDQIEAEIATDPEIQALREVLSGTPLEASLGNDIETAAARKAPARRRRMPGLPAGLVAAMGNRPARMAAVAALVAFVFAGVFAFRDGIVSALPGTARLYAAVGQPVNLRGLEFRNVAYETGMENGLPVLSVRGEVFNVTGKTIRIPEIGYSLRNGRMQELYFWTGKATHREVAPAQRVSFVTRLAAPPVEAEHIQIRFLRDKRKPGGRS